MTVGAPEKPDEQNPAQNPGDAAEQNLIDNDYYRRHGEAAENPTDPRGNDVSAGDSSDPRSTANDLLDDEQGADFNDKKGDLEDQEKSGDAGWSTNVSSKGARKIKGVAKNSKIMFAMIGVSFAVLGLIFSILSGAMGIVQIKENMLSKMSQRGADALEARKARIMAKKFANDITRGVCSSTVKVKCRYRGMSDKEIKKFNKRAERAGLNYRIDSDGRSANPLKKSIKIIEIDPKTGKETSIDADKYKDLVKNKPEFRKAFNAFYKGNVQYHAGRAGSFVLAKSKVYRGKIKAPVGEGDDENSKNKFSLRKMVRQAVSGETGGLESTKITAPGTADPSEVDPDTISDDVKKVIEEDVEKEKELLNDFSKDGSAPIEGSDAEQSRYSETIKDKIVSKGGGLSGLVGNPLAVAQPVCMARMIAAAANSSKSILQTIQLIRFSGEFIVLADQIKAGDGDSGTMKSLGLLMGMLSAKDEKGYTAFDSLGYNWVMSTNGAVKGTQNENVGKYQNGGYTAGTLGPAVTAITSSDDLKPVCKVAMSKTVSVISIGLTLIPGAGAIFKTGFSATAKAAISTVFKKSIKTKMDDIIDKQVAKTLLKEKLTTIRKVAASEALYSAFFYYGLPPLINSLSKSIAGTVVTGDEKGTDAGNALVSGFGATTAQTGKAQGMMPLNPDRAVATDNFAYENQLKLAKEDGINQFDFTNRFSFTSQLATNVLPLQAKFSSLTSLPTALSNISSSALSMSFSKSASAATDKKKQYTYCTDADEIYSEKNIATDPMCNPIYGLPAAAKDIDPEAVVDYLSGEGLIDEEGEPREEFTEFIEKCITSQTPIGDEVDGKPDYCLKGGGLEEQPNHLSDDDKKYAMMRLYCMDTSIDVDMDDGEGVSCIPKVESNSGSSSGEEVAPEEVDESTLFEPSDNIACAPGTSDLGIQDGYSDGNVVKIRICGVTGFESTGEESNDGFGVTGAGGACVVNSRVSAAVLAMFKSAKNDGLVLKARSCFRTMAHQQSLCPCDGVSVARPGYSNHQIGAAIDFQELESTPGPVPGNRVWEWLSANASKYSYKNYPAEAWHWSPTGH